MSEYTCTRCQKPILELEWEQYHGLCATCYETEGT